MLAAGSAATSRRTTVRASSGVVGRQPQRPGQHHLVQAAAGIVQLLQRGADARACTSGAGIVCAIRTVGSGRIGQSGSASVNRTACGRISAVGLDMSKGKAPTMIGVSRSASAACAPASRWVGGVHAVGDHDAVAAGKHEGRFGHSRRHTRVRIAGQPSAASWRTLARSRTPRSTRRPCEADALLQRQLKPAGDDGAGEVAVADEHHIVGRHVLQRQRDGAVGAVADLRDTFAAGTAVPPQQPTGHRLRISGVVRPSYSP